MYTPTESTILERLSDGLPHDIDEIRLCLNDELAQRSAVYFHVSQLRNKLRKSGQGISFYRRDRKSVYQLVRVMASPYRE